jgi:3'-phosphoadenosine 5'-phosphosulfate sulfotransferase (PAPS reductase)/FAD synthetase
VTVKTRHILGLSGGKDSSALAVYMKHRVPEMEYVFTDTGKELPETYEFLDKLEAFLGKPIARLNPERGFDHWLRMYGGYLPSSRMRWCTRQLKLKPFEKYVGNEPVISYVGIRADEDREGYISTKPNITARFPFKEAGITHADVLRILEEAGLGLPAYYEWRSRSGCYFCFFQQKGEWAGLLEKHPELFESAKSYEKEDPTSGERFTWQHGESLQELQQTERLIQIGSRTKAANVDPRLAAVLADEEDSSDGACLICSL